MKITPARRAPMVALLLCVAMTLGLAGCGKKGSPEAPGPADHITSSRSYPTQ